MNRENTISSSAEKAAQYLEASKICQEQLWKRRQIEWRTGFALWAAMGIAAGFAFIHVKRPILYPVWIFGGAVATYALAVIIYAMHQKAIFISNELDFDFLIYYRNRAEWELCKEDIPIKPERPEWTKTIRDKTWKKNYFHIKKKEKTFYPSVWITILIAVLSLGLIAIMCFGEVSPPPPTSIANLSAPINLQGSSPTEIKPTSQPTTSSAMKRNSDEK